MATKASKPTKPASQPASKPASTAVAVQKPGNIVSVQEQLAAQVAALAGKTAPLTGNTIRITQSKQFKMPDGTASSGPLQLVVLDFVSSNRFYEGAYDPDSIVPPTCFALHAHPAELVPSANSPVKQCDTCTDCPLNRFGSAGAGKACRNSRLLAVLPPDAQEDSPIWLLSVSPTAIKSWDGYVASVARTFGQPPVGVITEVSFDPAVDYASLRFGSPEPNPAVGEHLARVAEATELLMAEPDVTQYAPPAPAAAPARGRGRAPVRAPARKTAAATQR